MQTAQPAHAPTPRRRRLDPAAAGHLHALMGAWQLIADLSFADLLLFVPVEGTEEFQIVGQLRPYTARTLYPTDLVGGVEAVPVRHQGEVVAVLCVESAELPDRPTGRLESAYLRAADAMQEMVARGLFPFQEDHEQVSSPRVGDGLVVLDASARVDFASPNATSAFRRMGVNALPLGQPVPGRIGVLVAQAMAGRRPVEADVEGDGAVTHVRVVPLLRAAGRRRGALALCRDVTELRGRDRLISQREATIREVHHRVKNNLQTVASLLRLQVRRLGDHPMAVAALEESVRRIAAIALVHETLTEEFEGAVDMAEVARRVVRMLESSVGREDVRITLAAGSVRVDAAVATPLAVVLSELVQNSIEHGLGGRPGRVTVTLRGGAGRPTVLEVADDGGGSADGEPGLEASRPGGLGLRLVRALVDEELGGQFTLVIRPGKGSLASAIIPPGGD